MNKLRPPVKTHGGKYPIRKFIIENFPKDYENLTYVEPMCAGASVFLNKIPSEIEVINDIDTGMICVFKCLRDEPKEFISRLNRIKYNENVFKAAVVKRNEGVFEDYVDHGINEYVVRRMSRGGMKKAFAWSERLRGGQPGDVNAWETMIKLLPTIAERVKNTIILNRSMFEVVKAWDDENCLMYLDPPYMPDTRSEGSKNIYEKEMTVEEHMDLLKFAKNSHSKIMISGYLSAMYIQNLKEWRCEKKNVPNHSGQGTTKERRIEAIWMNYEK